MKRFKLHALFTAVAETLNRASFGFMQRMGLLCEVAHTAVEGFSDGTGTTYAISASLPATYNQAGYEASAMVYTAIGKVESFPEFGSQRNVAEFRPISGAVEKSKGSPNYGGGPMVMGDVPADAGQVILKAAEASANHYSMKLTYPDGEVHYIDVLVCSWRITQAQEATFVKRTAEIQLCKAVVVVAAV